MLPSPGKEGQALVKQLASSVSYGASPKLTTSVTVRHVMGQKKFALATGGELVLDLGMCYYCYFYFHSSTYIIMLLTF